MGNTQQILNDKLLICQEREDQIIPCEYHYNRINCDFFGMQNYLEFETKENINSFAPLNVELKELSKTFFSSLPAGSWKLVAEQRLWLLEQLKEKISSRTNNHEDNDSVLSILIAGAASYIHLYGQIEIILEAAKSFDIHIEVTVIDQCGFIKHQIDAVEKYVLEAQTKSSINTWLSINLAPAKLNTKGIRFAIPRRLKKFLLTKRISAKNLSIQAITGNLLDYNLPNNKQFDIITEHFLSSLLDKNYEKISAIRSSFFQHLKSGGYLLTADGAPVGTSIYNELVKIHNDIGFKENTSSSLSVWDPYDIDITTLKEFKNKKTGEKIKIRRGNTLFSLKKVPQDDTSSK